jgi:serine/threonine-protein kinase RsbW
MSDSIFPNASRPDPSNCSTKANDTAQPDPQEKNLERRIYTAQFENLDHVRQFVREAAEKCGLEGAAIYASQLAVDEAFSNIIEHAYGGECQEKIECTCLVTDTGLEITLQDCGQPFDPSVIPDPDLEADLEERDVGGLGLFFIRQLMDEVAFSFAQEAGSGKLCNVLRMVKNKES